MGQDEERQAIVKKAYLEIRQLRGQVEAEQGGLAPATNLLPLLV